MTALIVIIIVMAVIISWDQVIILKLRSDRRRFQELYEKECNKNVDGDVKSDNIHSKVSRDITKF